MIDQSYYPHDKVLESETWKKIVYIGGKWKYVSGNVTDGWFFIIAILG
jgi:hypothetical protein